MDECGVCGGQNSTCGVAGAMQIFLRSDGTKMDCTTVQQNFISSISEVLKVRGIDSQEGLAGD